MSGIDVEHLQRQRRWSESTSRLDRILAWLAFGPDAWWRP